MKKLDLMKLIDDRLKDPKLKDRDFISLVNALIEIRYKNLRLRPLRKKKQPEEETEQSIDSLVKRIEDENKKEQV